jgi:hypothetical protein
MISACRRFAGSALLGAAALAAPGALAAQDSTSDVNHLYDKFQASGSFTAVLNSSAARVDGSSGLGTNLDFATILDVPRNSAQPSLGFRWKPGRHTELDVGVQFINETGQRGFSDSIIIGDHTISGDISLASDLGETNATLQFKYGIWLTDRSTVGVAVGLGALFLDLKFDGSADVCDGPTCDAGAFSIEEQFVAPTASLGAFGQWRVGERWYIGGDVRGIGARVDRWKMSVLEADAVGQYFLSRTWGLTGAWYYTDVTLDVDATTSGHFSGKVEYQYSSIRLGVIAAF